MELRKRRESPIKSGNCKKSRTHNNTNESPDLGYAFGGCSQNLLTEAEVGIIEKISLTNFMCHSKLDFEFGPNINFIIGRNGSGKSAILTALVVGLGGKASVTNRGRNIKNFIKNGQTSAVIEVTLRNRGPDAFKPAEYGTNIVVERKILSDGASTYKVKGENDRIISTRKGELLSVLDHFNIQVDNPISVLNQETSRSFLTSKNLKHKYSLFLKATHLDQIKQSNADVAEKLQVAEDMLKQKEKMLSHLKNEVSEWEKKYKTAQLMEGQQDRLTELKKEYACALVNEKENECHEVHEKYSAQLHSLNAKTAEIEQLSDNLKFGIPKVLELQNKFGVINQEIDNVNKKNEVLKEEILKTDNEIRSLEAQKRKTNMEVISVNKQLSNVRLQIQHELHSESQDYGKERELRKKQICFYQDKVTKLIASKVAQTRRLHALRNSISDHREVLNTLNHECQNFGRQKGSLQQQLNDLEGSRNIKFQQFGQCIPALLNCIEDSHRKGLFHKKPIGPVGAYVSLHDPKWAVAVEACLGRVLEAFCCDNYEDSVKLSSMIRSIVTQGRKPFVIVSNYQSRIHNVRAHKVVCKKHPSILDMLIIQDVIVANTLIDQKSIESILLIENPNEARHIMTYDVPINCEQCFTINGDQIFPVPYFRYYSNNKTFAKYLKGSVEEEITELRNHCQELDNSLMEKRYKGNEVKALLRQNIQDEQNTESEITELTLQIAAMNSKLNDLMNFIEPEMVDTSSLETEVLHLEDKLLQLNELANSHSGTITEANEKLQSLKSNLQENNERVRLCIIKSEPIREKMDELNEKYANQKNLKEVLQVELKEQKTQVNSLRRKLESTSSEASYMRAKTTDYFPDKSTTRSSKSINCEMEGIQKVLNQGKIKQEHNEYLYVYTKYLETNERHKKMKEEISECSKILQKIKHGMVSRQQSFVKLRTHLSARINYHFSVCQNSRKSSAKIKFDHTTGTLTFRVRPNGNVQQYVSDMHSLSGGERSFSTVCFILALWDAMESPFRILDEYDVFMDMVNRRISMDMMMDLAKLKLNHQFIFLTPLEMSSVSAEKIVKVCRMPDPERRLE